MMSCEEFNRMLDNYENLTEQEKLILNEHAGECESCRDELDFMLTIIMQLNTLPRIETPYDFKDKLNKRISLEDFEDRKINRMLNGIRRNYKRYSTIAACLVLAVIVGLNGKSIIDNMVRTDDGGVIIETNSASETGSPEINSASEIKPQAGSDTAEISAEVSKNETSDNQSGNISKQGTAANNTESGIKSFSVSFNSFSQKQQIEPIKPDMSESINLIENVPQSGAVPALSRSIVEARAVGENSAADQPALQNDDAAINAQTSGSENENTEKSVENYTVAKDVYRLPDQEMTDEENEASTNTDDSIVQDLEIDDNSEFAIARGRYYIMTDSGYVNINNNELGVNGEDAERALELIQQYTDVSDDSYYVINSENISPMLEQMDREGIDYQNNVENYDSEKVGFKLVIE